VLNVVQKLRIKNVKCGSKIENQKCPICDRKKSWNVQFLRAVYTDLRLIYNIELKKI